jgi:hypothetical protein
VLVFVTQLTIKLDSLKKTDVENVRFIFFGKGLDLTVGTTVVPGEDLVEIPMAEYPSTVGTFSIVSQRNTIADHAHQQARIHHMLLLSRGTDPLLIDVHLPREIVLFLLHVI